jgi:hypothetical protein
MTDLSGFDAAYPPTNAPADQVAFGYLGGNTPHPWTRAEWAAQKARYRVGIWTRSNPTGAAQGTAEGNAAVAAWRGLGAPAGTLIALDLETAVNAAYVNAFDAATTAAGFKVAAYGSKSTLPRNPKPSGGYWIADVTNKPHLYPGATITQYEFESGWDDDEISGTLVGLLWDTQGGTEMALVASDIQAVAAATVKLLLGTSLPRAGAGETGTTTPAALAEWADSGVQGTRGLIAAVGTQVTALQAAVAKLAQPAVDPDELAAALAGDAAFVAAIATAVVAQIGDDLKPAVTG